MRRTVQVVSRIFSDPLKRHFLTPETNHRRYIWSRVVLRLRRADNSVPLLRDHTHTSMGVRLRGVSMGQLQLHSGRRKSHIVAFPFLALF